MKKSVIAVLAGLVLAGSSCSVAGANGLRIKPYRFEAAGGEVVKAELGTFSVPENRTKEKTRRIKLKFVRFRSTAEKPGSPIVYLAGGPGGSGINTARGARFPLFMAMREFGDVIALDQRGTGISGFEELDCDDRYMVPFDAPVHPVGAAQIISEVTRGCVDRLRRSGIDVSAYNTRESAADLEDLRQALEAEKLTLWGISYGTHLALATLKYHGEAVDRVILAGVEALHHSLKLPRDQQRLMEEIAEMARADPLVREVLPDLLGSVEKLLARLEKEPQSVRLIDPRGGEPVEVRVGKFEVQIALASMLTGPASFAAMPDVVARVERGDLVPLALAGVGRRTGEGFHGMTVAMDCASGASRHWTERIAREAETTVLGDAINFPFPGICRGLGIRDLGDEFRAPVKSDVPALIISGTLDGRTPVANGEEILPGLPNAQHLIIEGAGHSDPLFLASPQILASMQAFMRGLKIPSERIRLSVVKLTPPRRIAALSDEVLQSYVGTYRINKDEVRRVIKAGDLLFTQRGRWQPLPIRPTSRTEFFYEGREGHLTFEVDASGKVTGMIMAQDADSEGEPAARID